MRHTAELWGFVFYHGYLAVDIFFLLSGFVIAHAYGNGLTDGTITFRKFASIRLLRLYPVYFISLAIAALAWYAGGANQNELPMLLFATALFLPIPDKNGWDLFPLNPPYWSIFYELIANFMYALIHRFLTTKILIAIIALLGSLLILIAYKFSGLDVGTGVISNRGQVFSGIVRANLGFLGGLLIYRHQKKLAKLLPGVPAIYALLAATLLLMAPSFGRLNAVFDLLAALLIAPIVVIIAARGRDSRYASTLLALGAASYPMYLLHSPLNQLLVTTFGDSISAYAPLPGIAFLSGLIGFSIILERRFDIPLRRHIRLKLRSKRQIVTS